jgi:hypothetical protein
MIFAGLVAGMIPFAPLYAQDADGDGVPDAQDCQPTNNQLWRIPTEATNLRLSGAATTNLTWNAPIDPGGLVTPHYDVLRSATANGFASATCISAGNTATNYGDSTASGTSFYLVRSIQNCGGNLGTDSGGTPITGTDCGSCQVEYCNGVDDNCDNRIDETFPNLGQSCTAGLGICMGIGTYVCAPSQTYTVCNAVANPGAARDELCNGLDDDCDGQVDERVPVAGVTCYNGGAHACKGWADPMVHVGAFWIYEYEASRRDASSVSGGSDPTRACSNAGVIPWSRVTEAQAAAACAAVRNSAGNFMRLCTAAEWTAACNNGVSGNVWSYATTPAVYNSTTCNGFDRALGTAWATGGGASCYTNQLNGRIYDLSGNLAEWTSTPQVTDALTFNKVFGGSYNTPALGTSCNLDFFMLLPATALNDVGFRCCSDSAP